MWVWLSRVILRNRILLLVLLGIITIFMGFQATRLEMSYEYSQLLPRKDAAYVDYQKFRKLFGEEGNLIVVGVTDPDFFTLSRFRQWQQLNTDLRCINGVDDVVSVSGTYNLEKNTEDKKFDLCRVFPPDIGSQKELDSLVVILKSLPFYRGILYNPEENVFMLAITVNKDKIKSRERERMVQAVQERCEAYGVDTGLDIHFSGLPYIRVINSLRIKQEIYLFGIMAILLCITMLFLFFRSFKAVFIPLLVVLTGVVWSMGVMSLLGFRITLLTGMVPSLLIVIGIPNGIYMLNKYHQEFRKHGNRIKSLQRVIIRIGNAAFLTNLTTACGFATFIITNSDILRQFGMVASLSIMILYILSVIMIPTIFSFYRPPGERHMRHLENRYVKGLLEKLVHVTTHHKKLVYAFSLVVLMVGIYGITLIKSSGYMVDDISESDVIYKDLKYFESHVDGIMPMEVVVDTRKRNGAMSHATLQLMDKLEQRIVEYNEMSSSISLLNLMKFARQAFYSGKEQYFSLPSVQERAFILNYANNALSGSEAGFADLHSFIDSTQRITRMSLRLKDVGTKRMHELYDLLRQDVDHVFPADQYDVMITGSSVTFFKGTEYLVENLVSSVLLAVFIITSIMALMFHSWRVVIMSLVPNLLPLVFTAAIMGFTGIPIKASTILVFSIAFGISVDNTIHFLSKYRYELSSTGWDIQKSVKLALRETGVSMLYSFVVLFFGFGVYSISRFGGTAAMGTMVSLTLLVAVTSNLILLPSLLTGLERFSTGYSFREPSLRLDSETHLDTGQELEEHDLIGVLPEDIMKTER